MAVPRLLIWPESATYPWGYERSAHVRDDVARLAARGCTVLLNAASYQADGPRNSALVVGERGVVGRYAKRRLVPYGEYVPLGDVLPFIGTIARIPQPFRPGESPALYRSATTDWALQSVMRWCFPGWSPSRCGPERRYW